tara:strand:+ start:108 stop:1226 length:1119 start_codon:yes stop_codon:yes gene_type:complete
MRIPFCDIHSINNEFNYDFSNDFNRVLESGSLILSSEVQKFEDRFAEYCQTKYCVGVGNGLQALEIILRGWGISKDDEVIVPSNTFIASWLAISSVGGIPVPVEPDIDTYNINPDLIEEKITSRTKAIIVVHLYGLPCEMNKIKEIANRHSLKILEDAAQSHGAEYQSSKVGSLGDAAAFSFYPTKNLGALGDGGAITTDDEKLFKKVRLIRNYGRNENHLNNIQGMNSRLDELQAAFLSTKLKSLDDINQRRRSIAHKYIDELSEIESIIMPKINDYSLHAFHLFIVRHPERMKFREELFDLGVETSIHYPIPPHLQKAYSYLNLIEGTLPISETIHKECISIPIYQTMNEEQISYVVSSIKKVTNKLLYN